MITKLDAQRLHREYRGTTFFGSLDALRCLSILAVIWHHTGGHEFDLTLSRRGFHGVTLFFAISGFLITTLLLRERERTGDISLKKFYMRRSLRIFPLYYTVLLLYTVLVFLMERSTAVGAEFRDNLPAYATYTSNWFVRLDNERVIFYFAWSLATEEQFYLVWPWAQKYLNSWGPAVVMVALLVVAYLAQENFLGLPDGLGLTILRSLMPGICLGAILAHLLHDARTFRLVFSVLGGKPSSVIFLAAFVSYIAYPGANTWVVHALGTLLVGSCVAREDHILGPVFRFRPIAWMGMISYGMYLLHMLAKNGYDALASRVGLGDLANHLRIHPAIFQFFGATLIVVVMATFSFKYYESIFLRVKRKYDTVSQDIR